MFEVDLELVSPSNTTLTRVLSMSGLARGALLVVNLTIFLLGAVGNGVVLIGSSRFRAIKMDQCSRLFLENIAIADILIIIVKVLPRITVLALDGWHLGRVICFGSVSLKIPLFISESLVTTGLACYRLHVLRAIVNIVKLRTMKMFVVGTWCFAFGYISVLIGADMVGYFDPYLMGCGAVIRSDGWRTFQQTAGILLSFLPILLILLTNLWILLIAGRYARKRTGQRVPSRSAVLLVGCICWAFILSWVPYLTIWVYGFRGVAVEPVYRTVAEHAITINAIINPFIYTATNNTFRVFLVDLLNSKCGCRLAGGSVGGLRAASFSGSRRSNRAVRHLPVNGAKLWVKQPSDEQAASVSGGQSGGQSVSV